MSMKSINKGDRCSQCRKSIEVSSRNNKKKKYSITLTEAVNAKEFLPHPICQHNHFFPTIFIIQIFPVPLENSIIFCRQTVHDTVLKKIKDPLPSS